MRLTPALPLAAAIILLIARAPNAAAGPASNAATPKPESAMGATSLLLDSEPGEFLGGGEFNFYTPDDGLLEVAPYQPTTPGDVFLRFRGPRVPSWNLEFAAPPGETLAVEAYESAVPPYRRGPGQPGLQIDGGAGGCLNTFGRFEVKQIAFDAGGTLTAFRVTFEQTCQGKVLSGELRFNADVPVVLVAPSHRTVQEGHELSFAVTGHDLGGSPVALTATGGPAGATLTDAGDGTGRFAWTPDVGQAGRYWMALHGASIAGDSEAVYTRIDAFPDFDDFDTPIPITSLPFWLEIENPQASAAPDDPVAFLGPAAATVWYSFTPAEDARIQAYSQVFADAPDATVSVYSGERGALESIAYGLQFARADVVAGRTYHIMLGYPGSAPPQALYVDTLPPPPVNDTFDAATVVSALPFSETIEAGGARAELGEDPGMCGIGSLDQAPNVWYSYTPDHDTRLTIDTTGGPFGAMPEPISAFTGPYGALVLAACDYPRLSFTAKAGQTYHLMVSGPIIPLQVTLHVSITGAPPLGIDVTVAREGVVDPRSGRAVVHGAATCSRPAQITLNGTLVQGRGQAVGNFETTIACTDATPWSAEVSADPGGRHLGRLTPGPAGVFFRAAGVSADDSDDTSDLEPRETPIFLKAGSRR